MLCVGAAFSQDRVVPEQKIVGAEKAVPLGEIVLSSLRSPAITAREVVP
jgi:hypothetical protein